MKKTADEVINEIAETMRQWDGEFIERIANQVLTRQVEYLGDSVFEQAGDESIDRNELKGLEAVYKEMYLAELTDDIDCSPSTHQHRESFLKGIEEKVGHDLAGAWSRETEARAKEIGMASGAPYEE